MRGAVLCPALRNGSGDREHGSKPYVNAHRCLLYRYFFQERQSSSSIVEMVTRCTKNLPGRLAVQAEVKRRKIGKRRRESVPRGTESALVRLSGKDSL